MDWSPYIGIPFAERGRDRSGCDCWGLVVLVYGEQLGLELPELAYSDTHDRAAISQREAELRRSWRPVADPSPFDVVLLQERGWPVHVGICTGGSRMVHVRRGADSCVEDFSRPKWLPRVEGFYRHG